VVRLRGHHLLCLLGYRGMGYSEEYTTNMTRVHAQLREHPETPVTFVSGPDDLCVHFPPDQPYHCQDTNVQQRDDGVLARLGLQTGETRPWREVERLLARRFVPADIPRLCCTCPWLSYGVCEEGIRRIRAGEGLFPVPPGHNRPAQRDD
jgi:hypothetical protein